MRIPSNSTFTKELSKRFDTIFNKDMPLCELTTTIGKHNGQETSKVANAVRQVHNKRKGFGYVERETSLGNPEVGGDDGLCSESEQPEQSGQP